MKKSLIRELLLIMRALPLVTVAVGVVYLIGAWWSIFAAFAAGVALGFIEGVADEVGSRVVKFHKTKKEQREANR